MKFNKKIETFEMFGLTFEVRKERKTKCRFIYCNNIIITRVDMNMKFFEYTDVWELSDIMEQFQKLCLKNKIGKKEILEYISKKQIG